MKIANEAAYLYVYSKELQKLNRKLKRYSNKAQKHLDNHHRAKTEEKKLRHQTKHLRTKVKINKILKRHDLVLSSLRHHYLIFKHALNHEHKIKSEK